MCRIQGNNRQNLEHLSINAKIRAENIYKFSLLRDLRDEIPCAAEQGSNSTTTGDVIRANRELIRHIRELIPPRGPDGKKAPTRE
jgi:hypothetical protein